MSTSDIRSVPVALRPVPPAESPEPGTRIFDATAGGRVVARLALRVSPDAGQVIFLPAPDVVVASAPELAGLVEALVERARSDGLASLALGLAGPRTRHLARARGFVGALRSDLRLDLRASLPTPAQPSGVAERLVAGLDELVPGAAVSVGRGGSVGTFLRGIAHSGTPTFRFTARRDDQAPLQVSVPVVPDLMPEAVALAVDTALDIRGRFRPLLDRVRLFADEDRHGMRAGKIAGAAAPGVRDVHLNAAYVSLSATERLDRQAHQRAESAPAPSDVRLRRGSLGAIPPFTRIDAVVAHEFGHQLEFDLESARYRDSVEFRRVVGRYFGVETIEHLVKGNRSDSPVAWQEARQRLALDVSLYATTGPKEATAELFAQWWCTPADPPPSARFYATVLARFFPGARLDR